MVSLIRIRLSHLPIQPMKTLSYHASSFGSFAVGTGFITIHDSPRYRSASDDQLREWTHARLKAVRMAAQTELAHRKVSAWRDNE
jgi:hypothetical protein